MESVKLNKGLVDSLNGLIRGILLDIADYHPTLVKSLERDYLRLETLTSKHGEKVLTLFLPALGKIFDRSLESGVLVCGGLPLTRSVNRRTIIPRLFQGMWRLFFDDNGCLKQDIAPDDVRLMRTLLFAFKKYRLECSPSAKFKTVEEYYDVDQALPESSLEWDGLGDDLTAMRSRSTIDRLPFHTGIFSTEDFDGDDARLLSIVQEVGDRVSAALGEFLPAASRFRHGPGAVSDSRTGKAYKYAFPTWGPRLRHVFPAAEFAHANLSAALNSDDFDSASLSSSEGASRLIAVPKTQKGPRLIASEPTANQWCQQSVRSFLSDSIGRTFIGKSIDFTRQDLSGELALAASLSGELATVDLSSASDRLSCWLVERLFRANSSLLSAFIACRTRFVTNEIDAKSPKVYKLRKFAAMGSALTFPVQSLVFYIICVSAGLATDSAKTSRIKEYGRRVRVYGDDLIVPVEWMPVLQRVMHLLYLKINSDKTFAVGNFRESCGTDAYAGVNVSPGQVLEVYDESNLSTLQGVVACANNLFSKGFMHTANALLAPIPERIMRMIPWVSIGSESFGLWTSSGFRSDARRRWNHDLQYWEYATFSFRAKKSTTLRHESFANLLQYFTEDPSLTLLREWESGVFAKPTAVVGRGWEAIPL